MKERAISPLSHRAFQYEVDVVLVARNQDDRTVTNGEDETDTLRLGAVDFHAFQALQASQVGRIVRMSEVSNDRLVHHLLHVDVAHLFLRQKA